MCSVILAHLTNIDVLISGRLHESLVIVLTRMEAMVTLLQNRLRSSPFLNTTSHTEETNTRLDSVLTELENVLDDDEPPGLVAGSESDESESGTG